MPSAVYVSDKDLDSLRMAPSAEARERIFRSLALHFHPDKFPKDCDKAAATQAFQALLMAREAAQRASAVIAEKSVDSEGLPPISVMKQGDIVHGLAFSPCGEVMASCGDSGSLCICQSVFCDCRLNSSCVRIELDEEFSKTAIAVVFLSATQIAVAAGRCVEVWCLRDKANVCTLALEGRVVSLAVAEVSLRLAAGVEDGAVHILDWNQQSGQLHIASTFENQCPLNELVWAFGGKMIVVAVGSQVSLWQECESEWQLSVSLSYDADPCELFCIDVAGLVCAAGGASGKVAVWTLHRPTENSTKSWADSIESMAHSSHSIRESSDGRNDPLVDSGSLVFIATHSADDRHAVNSVDLSSDCRFLVSGGADCRVLLWCLYNKTILRVFFHRLSFGGCCLCTATVNTVRIAPHGNTIFAGGYDGLVTIWRMPQHDAVAV
jgi:WD40 repeat protein